METTIPVVTRSRLRAELEALGLREGDLVMLHASVKAIGWIVGGPEAILDAILDVLGPRGTLMMLVSWIDSPYYLATWPPATRALYLDECPAFDPRTSRADHRSLGVLVEYLRTRPGALRSDHPDGSFAALGPRAAWITAVHRLDDKFGPSSPLAKLCDAGGRVLLLGAPLGTVTALHYAEHLARLPEKRMATYRTPILRGGERVWVEISELDTDDGIAAWEGDYLETIVSEYVAEGRGRSGAVGAAAAHLFEAPDIVGFGARWMEWNLAGAPEHRHREIV